MKKIKEKAGSWQEWGEKKIWRDEGDMLTKATQEIYCKGKQRNGAVAGREYGVEGGLCFYFIF